MFTSSSCPLRYDCKDIIQRISKFEGDPTKFQRWKDVFVLHVDSKPWDALEKFEFLLETVGSTAAQCQFKDLHINDKLIKFKAFIIQNVETLILPGNSFEGLSATLCMPIVRALPRLRVQRFDDACVAAEEGECRLKLLINFLKREQSSLERQSAWGIHDSHRFNDTREKKIRQKVRG